jgi:hypothetical protein
MYNILLHRSHEGCHCCTTTFLKSTPNSLTAMGQVSIVDACYITSKEQKILMMPGSAAGALPLIASHDVYV